MNELIHTTIGTPLTMSSREIAELCGKEHKNVIRDIRLMLDGLKFEPVNFAGKYRDAKGEMRDCFNLPKRETLILVSGYSVELRAKIIDRWMELEDKAVNPVAALSDPSVLRGLLLENVEKVIALEARVEEMREDVQALEHLTDASGTFCRTEAAKNLGVPPHILIKWMRTNGWTYRRVGSKDDIGYQSKVSGGFLEHKVSTGQRPDGTEWVSTQVRVTAKGLAALAKAFPQALQVAS